MALVTEDGTGLSTAESFISVADADTYFSNRNLTLWASADFSTAEKEACLRRATDYMQQTYRSRWRGYRVNTTQALDWPRIYVPRTDYVPSGYEAYSQTGYAYYASDAVPVEVENACAELAWRAAFGELLSDQGTPVIEKTVGPITIRYAEGARQTKRYAAVDAILAPLLADGGSGSSARVIRA